MMIATALLQMHWDDNDHIDGGWWWVMGIGWLIFLLLITVVAFLLVRHFQARPPLGDGGATRNKAEDVLAERFARGEMDADEYRRRRDTLRE